MIELQPEILEILGQISTGIFIFLTVSAVVKFFRIAFRTIHESAIAWQSRRVIVLLEKISADTNAIGLQLLKLREEFMSDEDRLQERERQ